MFCKNCGNEIPDNTSFCPNCGAAQGAEINQQQYQQKPADDGNFGWAVLGFCIPLVGLILYLVWKGEKPKTAKKAGIGALVSACIGVVFYIISFAVGMTMV